MKQRWEVCISNRVSSRDFILLDEPILGSYTLSYTVHWHSPGKCVPRLHHLPCVDMFFPHASVIVITCTCWRHEYWIWSQMAININPLCPILVRLMKGAELAVTSSGCTCSMFFGEEALHLKHLNSNLQYGNKKKWGVGWGWGRLISI